MAAEDVEICLAEKFLTNQLHCLSEAAQAADDPKLCLLAEEVETALDPADERFVGVLSQAQCA